MENDKLANILQKGEVVLYGKKGCNVYKNINNGTICANKPIYKSGIAVDTCDGDSGGPLFFYNKNTNRSTQIGITSFGNGCGQAPYPGAYARVHTYRKWINDTMTKMLNGQKCFEGRNCTATDLKCFPRFGPIKTIGICILSNGNYYDIWKKKWGCSVGHERLKQKCTPCKPNWYNDEINEFCKPCPVGTASDTGAAFCI